MRSKLKRAKTLYAPVHTKNHWVLAVITQEQNTLVADIYDSAPSKVTRSDIRTLLKKCGVYMRTCHTPRIQPRGSNDCGVHVLVTASCFAVNVSPYWLTGLVSMSRAREFISKGQADADTARQLLSLVDHAKLHSDTHLQRETILCSNIKKTGELSGGSRNESAEKTGAFPSQHDDSRAALIKRVETRGAFIDVEVIDILLSRTSITSHKQRCTYVSGLQLWSFYHNGNSDFPVPLTGCIVSFLISGSHNHFAALCIDVEADTLQVFDSLHDRTCAEVAEKLTRALFRRHEKNFHVQYCTSCPRQTENDCALHTVNNILYLLQGDGTTQFTHYDRTTAAAELRRWSAEMDDEWDRQHRQHAPRPEVIRTESHHFMAPGTCRLTHGAIHQRLSALSIGETIEVHWSYDDHSADRWRGDIILKQRSQAAVVRYSQRLCPDCLRWRAMSDIEAPLPFRDTVYYSIERVSEAAESLCSCPWLSSDEGSTDSLSSIDSVLGETTAMENNDGREMRAQLFQDERVCNTKLGMASRGVILGNVGRFWHIYTERPPHVHMLTWRQYAESTRKHHIRWLQLIKNMPEDLWKVPLPVAIIELTLRIAKKRNWKWSTLAGALSAAASALMHLQLYSNAISPICIREDSTYQAALRRAQHLAKICTRKSDISEALEFHQYSALLGEFKDPKVVLLFELAWHFAARLLDISMITVSDISILEEAAGGIHVAILFRFGKGARFWGPYTIRSVVPKDVGKRLKWFAEHSIQDIPIFSYSNRRAIGAKLREIGLTSKAIRRGAIVHAARAGVPDENLMLLSGHRRKDTLLRYLGWGYESSSAKQAAEDRAKKTQLRGGEVSAPVMGIYSGRVGNYGRRTSKPPRFMPLSAPNRTELGLTENKEDTKHWALHVKGVTVCKVDVLHRFACEAGMEDEFTTAIRWCTEPGLLGKQQTYDAKDVPALKITIARKRQLVDAGKLAPHFGPIRGYVRAFLLPQPRKKTLRPIFEPSANGAIQQDALPKLSYPSRYERRALLKDKVYVADFDMAAYFDQIGVHQLADYLVVKVRTHERCDELMRLTRLPMGARFAPFVAQTITWTLTSAVAALPGVQVLTMLDNVLIATNNPTIFITAVELFLERCDEAGIQLNDSDEWRGGTAEILQKGRQRTFTFLGETYTRETVENTESCIHKLREAMALMESFLQDGSVPYTRRNFAALIGLIVYMTHTLGIALNSLYTLLRAYSAIVGDATTGPSKVSGWDTQLRSISPAVQQQIRATAGTLLINKPVQLPTLRKPRAVEEDYDLVCIVDASKVGWGAFIGDIRNMQTWKISERWRTEITHSASAEPVAVTQVMKLVRRNWPHVLKLAMITDHSAIVAAQRDWRDGYGGFSASYHLNELYRYAYGTFEVIEFYHIEGVDNIADNPSRNPAATAVFVPVEVTLPALSACWHPAHTERARPSYAW